MDVDANAVHRIHFTTLHETNSSPLKINGWKMNICFWDGICSEAFAASFRECLWMRVTSPC